MSSFLARAVYGTLSRSGLPALRRRLKGGAPIFCLHNVVPEAEVPVGDASLHLSTVDFRAILEWMTATWEVVSLDELAGRLRAGRDVRGLAAVTFDDACRGVYEHAAPVLARAGVPATSFVVSRATGSGAFYWWDLLAERGRLDPETRTRCLEQLHGQREPILREVLGGEGPVADTELPGTLLPADWATVLAGPGRGLSIQAHTATHPNLSRLPDDELSRELEVARHEIGERTGTEPELLSYPYGLASPRVHDAARAAGYRAAVTMRPAVARPTDDPLALPRINIPAGVAVPVLDCWASGLRIR